MGVSAYSITLGVGRKHINGLIIELDKDKTPYTGYGVSKIHVKQRYFDVVKKRRIIKYGQNLVTKLVII